MTEEFSDIFNNRFHAIIYSSNLKRTREEQVGAIALRMAANWPQAAEELMQFEYFLHTIRLSKTRSVIASDLSPASATRELKEIAESFNSHAQTAYKGVQLAASHGFNLLPEDNDTIENILEEFSAQAKEMGELSVEMEQAIDKQKQVEVMFKVISAAKDIHTNRP